MELIREETSDFLALNCCASECAKWCPKFSVGGMGVFELPAMIEPGGGMGNFIAALAGIALTMVISFALTMIFRKETPVPAEPAPACARKKLEREHIHVPAQTGNEDILRRGTVDFVPFSCYNNMVPSSAPAVQAPKRGTSSPRRRILSDVQRMGLVQAGHRLRRRGPGIKMNDPAQSERMVSAGCSDAVEHQPHYGSLDLSLRA